ncbi:class I SAM-dependent methyltransferase [Nitratifractor salsuginis]|uniref:Methyltransferase type 12 n=1 Tax=Nitratifractor salsuginis (strain DSM 16511 / JCM 12458 / E9I37-1) TaxID=749222 RepID=E6X0S9_NITSE|nr:class I SAM-dependent methyltransferase [Nitratifractor salsuginis]ADV45799.1 Methyltransferase type 12 [Nitratifractor salsuginis DSM 16511]
MTEPNPSEALDLYAKVEDLLGVKEAAPRLYAHYLLALQSLEFGSLLDVGCGSGDFLKAMQGAFPEAEFSGIDLSPEMVRRARKQGVEAHCSDLCELPGRYDVITCVFDMLNYLSDEELVPFLHCLKERLNPNGVLLCDLNTLYGFEEVAVGAFVAEDEGRFVAIESEFEAGIYRADFTLFEKEGACWRKSEGTIRQYYRSPEKIAEVLGAEILLRDPVSLYTETPDKLFLAFAPRP